MDDAAGDGTGMWNADAASRGAGVRLLEVGPNRARAALMVEDRHLNGHGIVHGGYLFLLADTAMAFASNGDAPAVASGADIAFLAPVGLGAELVAEAVQRAVTGRSGLWDVTVRAVSGPAAGSVVAEFRGRTRQVPRLAGTRQPDRNADATRPAIGAGAPGPDQRPG